MAFMWPQSLSMGYTNSVSRVALIISKRLTRLHGDCAFEVLGRHARLA